MKKVWVVVMFLFTTGVLLAQEHQPWKETDRKYLLTNLTRTRDELVKEIANLTKEQWSFKPDATSWSVNETVEHLMKWELLFDHEISNGITSGLKPHRMRTASPDSSFLNFIMAETSHHTPEYTQPFTYAVPTGMADLSANIYDFVKMRNESIEYIRSTNDDLRAYFNNYGSIHQIYIYVWGHTDRHLRQIRAIKTEPRFPK